MTTKFFQQLNPLLVDYYDIKGQMKWECIYEIIDFPKYHWKNLIDFCPGRFYRLGTCDLFWLFSRRLYSGECITYLVWINFQGRNLSNFSVVFWKIYDFINTFWLHLTFRKVACLMNQEGLSAIRLCHVVTSSILTTRPTWHFLHSLLGSVYFRNLMLLHFLFLSIWKKGRWIWIT